MTYIEILKDRIKTKEIKTEDAVAWLKKHGEMSTATALAFLWEEEIKGMNQTLSTKLFYGDEAAAPEEFTGFVPRYENE